MTYASEPYPTGKYWLPKNERIEYIPENLPATAPDFLHTNISVTYLAVSEDMVHWKKLGRLTDTRHDDRDVFFFPEKVNGKFIMLSRSQNRVGAEYGAISRQYGFHIPTICLNGITISSYAKERKSGKAKR